MKRLSTGVPGLDEILKGGLVPVRAYMVRGGPGAGKTISGLHFLTAMEPPERGLLIALGEPAAQIRDNAGLLGLDVSRIEILDLSPTSGFFTRAESYDVFSPAEVEREPTMRKIYEAVETVRPARVFVDGLNHFRYLSSDNFQFRKQIQSFLRYLNERMSTVLFSSEFTESPDEDLQFLSDGVFELDMAAEGRTVRVIKFRGSDFRHGRHAMRITERGLEVFPRLLPEEHSSSFIDEQLHSGVRELDALIGGGLERGTISLITGPSGVGKTTVGLQFMKEAARRGERSLVYLFEERRETLLRRCEAIGIPVGEMVASGALSVVQVEPLRYSPDQFADMVRKAVEETGPAIVMIDSVAGYRLSLAGGDVVARLHALAKYLQNVGVAVLLINEVEAITGDFKVTEIGISYMADNVIFMRYLEIRGEMCKAIGVLKKRLSDFEKTLREIRITGRGIEVGRRLSELRGILSGTPQWDQAL